MEKPPSLSSIFLEVLKDKNDPRLPASSLEQTAIDACLLAACTDGRRRLPDASLDDAEFVRYVALRFEHGSGLSILEQLQAMPLSDLQLAWACLQGVVEALQALEKEFLEKLRSWLAKRRLSSTEIDDILQNLRLHLLMGSTKDKERSQPHLLKFYGKGSLMSWLRVTVIRLQPNKGEAARESPEPGAPQPFENIPDSEDDAEWEIIKKENLELYKGALKEAFDALSPKQRELLRFYYLDGLSTTSIARMEGKNQSTISRQLETIRRMLFEDTRRRIKERLPISSHEFMSILNLIESQFYVSLHRLLKESGPD